MSSTMYQTNARPRGRRGSHGEVSDKPSRSRASSSASASASAKLSKTLSRTLDEVSVPRNTRTTSPAVYMYRQRTADGKLSDPTIVSSRLSTISTKSDKNDQYRQEADTTPKPASPTKTRVQIIQNTADESRRHEISEPIAHIAPSTEAFKYPPTAFVPMTANESGPQSTSQTQFSSGIGRRSQSSRSLASMQPTVAEEADEASATIFAPGYSTTSIPTMPQATVPTPFTQPSRGSIHEEVTHASPRTSKSSLHDTPIIPFARSSTSSLHEPLVAPTPQGPVAFIQPSLDQRLAESVDRDIQITSSPTLAAEVTVGDFMPEARSPMASPPLSPYIHQPMGSPPPQPLPYPQPYPYQYPPQFMPSPNFPPQAAFYPPPFTPPTAQYLQPGEIPRVGSTTSEDERSKLLEKVSNVLPDINRLLHFYQESEGLLSEKENLVKQAESQHSEEMTRLKIELSACKEEYEKIIGEQASENVRLKGELAEQAEKLSLLEDSPHGGTKSDEGLTSLRLTCETLTKEAELGRSTNQQLETEKKLLESELQTLKDQLREERTQHERLLMESKQAHDKDMASKEQAHARSLHEHKVGISKIQLDLAGMITKHTQQKKELDAARAIITDHERSLVNKEKEFADAVQLHQTQLADSRKVSEEQAERHKREVGVWSRELSETITKHEDEVSRLQEAHQKEMKQSRRAAEDRLLEVTTTHEQRQAKAQAEVKTLRNEVDELNRSVRDERDKQSKLKSELATAWDAHDKLKSRHEKNIKHHTELAETMVNLRNKQVEWQRESDRMDRILQSLGHASSKKSRSDEYLSNPGTYR